MTYIKGFGFHLFLPNNCYEIDEQKYIQHKQEAEALIKELKKKDRKRKARIDFYSKH